MEKKLPVFKTAREVFAGITTHYFQLAKAAWPALILLAIALVWYVKIFISLEVILESLKQAQLAGDDEAVNANLALIFADGRGLQFAIILFLMFVASAIAAVRWHRFVLLGEGATDQAAEPTPIRSEDGVYIWTFIKIVLCEVLLILVAVLFAAAAGYLLGIVGLVAVNGEGGNIIGGLLILVGGTFLYFLVLSYMLRLMLALPDAAIGQGGRVFTIFQATKSNGWRLLGVYLVFLLAAMLIGLLMAAILGVFVFALVLAGVPVASLEKNIAVQIITGIAYAAIYLYFLMAQITMLSVAYREIIGLPGDAAPDAPEGVEAI
ncbi:MAG: hypothetical protein GC184_07255 [Rhizobiales bacterium]|nr:hypothetical protein [Hyphomicrobiales bacterium]